MESFKSDALISHSTVPLWCIIYMTEWIEYQNSKKVLNAIKIIYHLSLFLKLEYWKLFHHSFIYLYIRAAVTTMLHIQMNFKTFTQFCWCTWNMSYSIFHWSIHYFECFIIHYTYLSFHFIRVFHDANIKWSSIHQHLDIFVTHLDLFLY